MRRKKRTAPAVLNSHVVFTILKLLLLRLGIHDRPAFRAAFALAGHEVSAVGTDAGRQYEISRHGTRTGLPFVDPVGMNYLARAVLRHHRIVASAFISGHGLYPVQIFYREHPMNGL